MIGLLGVLEDERTREALEFDLLGMGLDLGQIYTGVMTLRRLRVLYGGLGAQSRVKTVIRQILREQGAPGTPIEEMPPEAWSEESWQLAAIRDELATANWLFVSANSSANSQPDRPEAVPRPGVPKKMPGASAWFSTFAAK
jgi:hypothetical protein